MWQVVLRCDRRVHLLLIFSFALYLCSRSALFVILCSYMCILHFGAAAWSSRFKSCAKDMLTCQHTRKHLTTCSLIMFRQTGIFAYRRQQFGSGVQLLFQRWLTFRPIRNLALGKPRVSGQLSSCHGGVPAMSKTYQTYQKQGHFMQRRQATSDWYL